MPSPKRTRTYAVTAILAFLVFLYFTTGPSNTESNAFYRKTLAVMESRAQQAEALLADRTGRRSKADTGAPEPDVRERLKDAELQAKKSADERYRKFQDASDEWAEEAQAHYKSVAGRKVMPAEADQMALLKEKEQEDKMALDLQGVQKPVDVEKLFAQLTAHAPVTIFSKSFCPYSKKAKHILLEEFEILPKPYVVELDQSEHGSELQDLLLERTGRRTVPNVLVAGKSAGGGDDMAQMWEDGTLSQTLLRMAGGKLKSVKQIGKPHVAAGGLAA